MTICENQQQSDHSLPHQAIPKPFVDSSILYENLKHSIAAKRTALEIKFNQICNHQVEDTMSKTCLDELFRLAEQYDLDLIQEALVVIIEHSALQDFSNLPTRLPITDNALEMTSGLLNQEYETISLVSGTMTESTYTPSIVAIDEPNNMALMGTVGAFAIMNEANIKALKHQMMAASLILPDYFVQKSTFKYIDTVHLVLIDISNRSAVHDNHLWPLKNINNLLCVAGAAEAIQNVRNALKNTVNSLQSRVAEKLNAIEKPTAQSEQPKAITPTKVRVAFLERPSTDLS